MSKHIKKFENESEYQIFKESAEYSVPNLSWCREENTIKSESLIAPHETRLVAKYDVFGTGYATQLQSALTSNIASMEIDGVELQSPVSAYTFDTVGEHTVKFTLLDNTTIGTNAFESCTRLTSITIPDSVITIGDYAFSTCTTLTSLTIPDSVTTIERSAFASCGSLSSVTIGSGITSIGKTVFENCGNLSSITYNGTQTQWATVTKGTNWNRNVPATVVHCTDGDVTL